MTDWRCFGRGNAIYCSPPFFKLLCEQVPIDKAGLIGTFIGTTRVTVCTREELDAMEADAAAVPIGPTDARTVRP